MLTLNSFNYFKYTFSTEYNRIIAKLTLIIILLDRILYINQNFIYYIINIQ